MSMFMFTFQFSFMRVYICSGEIVASEWERARLKSDHENQGLCGVPQRPPRKLTP